MDFVSDGLDKDWRIKCQTAVDDFTHECVDVAPDFGFSGQHVTRILDQADISRGYPRAMRTHNGLQFTSWPFTATSRVSEAGAIQTASSEMSV
jgi:putative transposase